MRITAENYKNIPFSAGADAVPCKNGSYTLLLRGAGSERLVHSRYDPQREAAGQVSGFLSALKKRSVIVFGLGMAYHIDALLDGLPEGGELCVFEPRPHVCRLYADYRGGELFGDGRVRVFAYGNEEELQEDVKELFTLENCGSFGFFAQPVYGSVCRVERGALVKAINAAVNGLNAQMATIRGFGCEWSKNYLLNYEYLFESAAVKGLFGLFEKKTAIVVSAGPSLSKNVGLLKRVGDKAFIICADTAFKALEAIKVRPHLTVSVSGSPLSCEKLRDTGYGGTPLVYKSQTVHETVRNHGGIKFYSEHSNNFLNDALKGLGIDSGAIRSFGSVACSCLDLAVQMGAKTVVLIGQDFALTGGKTHAKGVFGFVYEHDLKMFTTETKDIYGNTVKTLKNLNMYRKWFEEYIAKRPDVRFIDATEGGALIAGTEIMSFAEALKFLGEPLKAKKAIERAFLNGLCFGGSGTRGALDGKYQEAYADFLRAKEILNGLISAYEEGSPPGSPELAGALEQIKIYTSAVAYAVLAELYDIQSMNIGADAAKELAVLKTAALKLEGLTEHFKAAARTEE